MLKGKFTLNIDHNFFKPLESQFIGYSVSISLRKINNKGCLLDATKETGTEKLWKLKKYVYGLTDTSRHWYLQVAEELSELGVQKSIYDEAVFYCYFGNVLHGIICTHLDDFFWGEPPDSKVLSLINRKKFSKSVKKVITISPMLAFK